MEVESDVQLLLSILKLIRGTNKILGLMWPRFNNTWKMEWSPIWSWMERKNAKGTKGIRNHGEMILPRRFDLVAISIYLLEQIKCRKNSCSCQRNGWVREVSTGTDSTIHIQDLNRTSGIGTCGSTHLLPNPKATSIGSLTDLFNFPSCINRSGLNSCGSGYSFSSYSIALRNTVWSVLHWHHIHWQHR